MANKQQAEDLKLQANACVEKEDYKEAIKLYSAAIKCDPKDQIAVSNRSLAFLKLHQYSNALHDSERVIRIEPRSPLGYYRRGEVEFATGHYSKALGNFQLAFILQPGDSSLIEAMTKAKKAADAFQKRETRDPWVFTGIGLIFGAVIALLDWTITPSPSIKHPFLIVLLTLTTSLCGYGVGRAYRFYLKTQRDGLLDAPLEPTDFDDDVSPSGDRRGSDKKVEKAPQKHHYSKAAARRRYKLGKGDK